MHISAKEARKTTINEFDNYMDENLYDEEYLGDEDPIVLVTIKNEEEEKTDKDDSSEIIKELVKVKLKSMRILQMIQILQALSKCVAKTL